MANKRRPKKVKPPYRKYVGGVGFTHTQGFSQIAEENDTTNIQKFNELQINEIRNPSDSEESRLQGDSVRSDVTDYGGMKLPLEIFDLTISMMSPQDIRMNLVLVCRAWYLICIPKLYRTPKLTSRNFLKFVETVLADRKRKTCEHVVHLDLSPIIQSGKNSYVSKVLRRCSKNLVSFTAPQTSFGIAPLISLKSCQNLKYLDLGLVSETVNLKELFLAIKNFHELTHLSFPRSSIQCDGYRDFQWPPNLQYLKLSGGITNEFVQETIFPNTIKILEFSFCPQINEHSIYTVLAKIGDNLTQLYFHYPMPALKDNSLDHVFRYCSNLKVLQLMIDYCTRWVFSEYFFTQLPYPRPLRTLILECSGHLGQTFKVHPDDLTIAICEGRLPCLKIIRISSRLGWDSQGDDVGDLVSSLEEENGGSMYITY
ncbi:Pfu1p [Kluyveromyces lactis]|uniref:KLLA0C10120p n=1 Tax=Kluyveromyces lactis (strain ATCC 8585 / CBS 2359 / DSM 70799 / NBRC 1267 / NRRL Y-1140 / WM37) TaxID=284590 RepID=Q6CTT9_KLULA|nr:uncharacterized protein KLLA0_C10120g [Kluyveromyces lactis]CAH01501.1 KLLA0C10120p [Kluyveromyces lactis]|eukprot:XP_452650.1 uncharacterized protein KLLA0_C10120g [Kluyveromyces lactis]